MADEGNRGGTRIGILTGTGFSRLEHAGTDAPLQHVRVETPYGAGDVDVAERDGRTTFFLNRHLPGHRTPAHRVDHRANVEALRRCHVDVVFSLLNTGGLRPGLQAGDLLVPHDFVDFTGATPSLFDEEAVHVDLTEPYCPYARDAIHAAAGNDWDRAVHPRGVYVQTRGPRLETPAEVAHLARLGDVVGMTGATEAALAREAGICHAALAFVANPAAGLAHRLDAQEIRHALAAHAARLSRILAAAAVRFPHARDCSCRSAPGLGRIAPRPTE